MSMGAILQQVRDHLRSAMSLGVDQCDVRPGGMPTAAAGEFYVAVDELGVQSTAQSHLREQYEIEVSIWRRTGQYPDDRLSDVVLRDDVYLAGIQTLDDLERSVIKNLHANYTDITAAANTAIDAGAPGKGDIFQLALYYTGRSRSEVLDHNPKENPAPWLGRRLKFTGMIRVQATDVMQ